MHRNTYLLVIVLAVFAALIVGVNIGKKFTKPAIPVVSLPTPTQTPTPVIQTYTDTFCGFSLSYPSNFTILDNASGSAILNNTSDKMQSITLTCQKNIPAPKISPDNIETFTIPAASGASISAKLYTDTVASVDAVIFHNPANGMDGFIAGFGTAFNAAIKTIRILP